MSRLGRKGGMMVCAAMFRYSIVQCITVHYSTVQYMMMFSLSLLLLAAASNVIMIYLGRVCCGLCTGGSR